MGYSIMIRRLTGALDSTHFARRHGMQRCGGGDTNSFGSYGAQPDSYGAQHRCSDSCTSNGDSYSFCSRRGSGKTHCYEHSYGSSCRRPAEVWRSN